MSELKTNYGLLLRDVMSRIVAAKMSCVKCKAVLITLKGWWCCTGYWELTISASVHTYTCEAHTVFDIAYSLEGQIPFFSIYVSSRQRSSLYLSLVNIGYNIEADMLSLWRFQLRIVLSHWTKNRDLGHPNVLSAQSAVNWITFASTYTYA